MGYDFLLKKKDHGKLCRVRKQIEKLGPGPGLEDALTPSIAAVQFRCQASDATTVRKGDRVVIFTSGSEVSILKHNIPVGLMNPHAASDFMTNFSGKACPEFQLGEVESDPSPLDKSFDVEVRPPWKTPEPPNPSKI